MDKGRVAVMGAGAVGCFYGARLAEAGEEVTLIGRSALAEAVAERGLKLEMDGGVRTVELSATADPAGVAGADLVLFSVKSGDLDAAGRAIAPHLDPGAVVVSLQNGVGNAERLEPILGRPVVQAVVYVAVDMGGPGHVRHHGRGELILSETEGSARAAERFRAAGVPVEVSADAASAMWTKFTVNCVYNAISAIARLPYGRIVSEPGVGQLMADVAAECRAVAEAEGVKLAPNLETIIETLSGQMPDQYSSTAQDLMRGRKSEIDFLNGEVVRRAATHGIPVPANNALWAAVKLLETAQG